MSRKGIWILAAILIVAAGCGPKADNPKDVAALKAMSTAWGTAQTAGDVAALTGLFADDAVRLGPNAPMEVGKAAIQASLQAYFDKYKDEAVNSAEDVRIIGDLAYARGIWKSLSTPKLPGAAVIDDKGKWVSVYRRQPDGSWKIIIDTFSSDLPAVQVQMPGSADELALLQLERDWSAAWTNQDAGVLDGILADSYLENLQGKITTKSQLLAEVKSGIYKVESLEANDMRVVVFGDHAVVNGLTASKGVVRGQAISEKRRWTDTYEKQDGRWRAVFTHYINIE
jgi:uncharacterized protein (TIGR02246 family)